MIAAPRHTPDRPPEIEKMIQEHMEKYGAFHEKLDLWMADRDLKKYVQQKVELLARFEECTDPVSKASLRYEFAHADRRAAECRVPLLEDAIKNRQRDLAACTDPDKSDQLRSEIAICEEMLVDARVKLVIAL
jgi:hypothetical protein